MEPLRSLESDTAVPTPVSPERAVPLREHGIRRVLVCLDRSPFSELCVPYALCLCRTFGATLTLLHVLEDRTERVGPQSGPHSVDPVGWELARREASDYLERWERQTKAVLGPGVDTRLEQGRPADRISALSGELGADVTVLGGRGENGVAAWDLGSTVQQVLAVAGGSVLVVHSAAPADGAGFPRRILLPLDGSPRTESVLPTAARLAHEYGAELLLVHVVDEPCPTSVLRAPHDLELAHELARRLEASARRYLEQLRGGLAREGAVVRCFVERSADKNQCLLGLEEPEQVDLVILSAHGTTCNAARPFGSVTGHLLAHSTRALLVLQDMPRRVASRPVDGGDEEGAPALRASYAPGPP
jgi:nucleotide-binding universal stress UspA family protein